MNFLWSQKKSFSDLNFKCPPGNKKRTPYLKIINPPRKLPIYSVIVLPEYKIQGRPNFYINFGVKYNLVVYPRSM